MICQSCAMEMTKPEHFGTNADGSASADYCVYCFKDGAFPNPDETMEEMIATCLPFVTGGNPFSSEEEAVAAMRALFPTLKRWK